MGGLSETMNGCVVLITADRRSSDLATALQRHGATIRHAPAMSIVPHIDDEQLIRDTRMLLQHPPEILVVTTGIGFRGWIEAADAAGLAHDLTLTLRATRIIARGPKARGAIQAAGLGADWVAESETSAEILDHLLAEGVRGRRIAVQHHGAGADDVDTELAAAGARVQSLVVYRWGPPPDPEAVVTSTLDAANGEIDCVVFTSAPGAATWLDVAERAGALAPIVEACEAGSLLAAAVGPVTARPLEDVGITPLVPDRGRLGALVRTIVAHYQQQHTAAVVTAAGSLQVRNTVALLDGHVLPISPSGVAVLRVLAEAGGEVVTRQQVLEALPGTSTDPHAAEVAIARVRDALGRPGLITTVVKRGYRLALA